MISFTANDTDNGQRSFANCQERKEAAYKWEEGVAMTHRRGGSENSLFLASSYIPLCQQRWTQERRNHWNMWPSWHTILRHTGELEGKDVLKKYSVHFLVISWILKDILSLLEGTVLPNPKTIVTIHEPVIMIRPPILITLQNFSISPSFLPIGK